MTIEHSTPVHSDLLAQTEKDDSTGQSGVDVKELDEVPTERESPLALVTKEPEDAPAAEAPAELAVSPTEAAAEAPAELAVSPTEAAEETGVAPSERAEEAVGALPEGGAESLPATREEIGPPAKPPESTVEASLEREISLSGALALSRLGHLRLLSLVTGLALMLWVGRAVLAILGYRHRGTINLKGTVIKVTSERSFMGVSWGSHQDSIPITAVENVRYARRSNVWSVIAGLAALILTAAIGMVLLLWGIVGRQPSWVVLGLTAIGCGVLIDALAFLWGRRQTARRLATLAISTSRKRFLFGPVEQRGAGRLMEALHAALAAKH